MTRYDFRFEEIIINNFFLSIVSSLSFNFSEEQQLELPKLNILNNPFSIRGQTEEEIWPRGIYPYPREIPCPVSPPSLTILHMERFSTPLERRMNIGFESGTNSSFSFLFFFYQNSYRWRKFSKGEGEENFRLHGKQSKSRGERSKRRKGETRGGAKNRGEVNNLLRGRGWNLRLLSRLKFIGEGEVTEPWMRNCNIDRRCAWKLN